MHEACATRDRGTRWALIVGLAPPPSETRRAELADFLRRRRAQVTPAQAGIEANGRRRTPGLRREEVAQLAGVGLSWYTWLEQGRDVRASGEVLSALAEALQLYRAERQYLFHLTGHQTPETGRTPKPEVAHPLQRMLRTLSD